MSITNTPTSASEKFDPSVVGTGPTVAGANPGPQSKLEWALWAVDRGLAVFPLIPNGKEPFMAGGFHNATLDKAKIAEWWAATPDANIGIAYFKSVPAAAAIDVDTKDPEKNGLKTWRELTAEHGETPTLVIRTVSGGYHYVYQDDDGYVGADQQVWPGIDTRGIGGYGLGPGSYVIDEKHGLDGPYTIAHDAPVAPLPEWVKQGRKTVAERKSERRKANPIADEHWDTPLAVIAGREAIEHELAKYGTPRDGGGSDGRAIELCNRLLDFALHDAIVLDLLKEHWQPAFDRDWYATKLANAHRYRQNDVGCDRPQSMSERAAAMGEQEQQANADWPEPVDIFGDLLTPEPKLTRDMLPPVIADFAFDAALGFGIEPAGVAVPCLAACAGAIDDAIVLQPREHDTNWTERPCLWVANVSPSGSNKTAAQNAAISPLREIEKEWRIEDDTKFRAYEAEQEAYKVKLRGVKENTKAFAIQGADLSMPFPAEPQKPPRRRTIATDFTMEALREILVDNERGVTLVFDELATLMGSFGTYNNGGMKDRALALELYNGGYQPADRKKGSTVCNNWSAGIIGGVQPAKLAAMAAKNGLSDDGLLQRFWLYNAEPTGPGMDRTPDAEAQARYRAVVRALAKIAPKNDCEQPVVLTLAPDARPYWEEIEGLSYSLSQEHRLPAACRQHMQKVRGMYARLLLTMHLIELVDEHASIVAGHALIRLPWKAAPIGAATAKRARDLVKRFFIPQAIRTYADIYPADESGVQLDRIARAILAHGEDKITARDIGQRCREYRGDEHKPAIRQSMKALAEHGWVKAAAIGEYDKWLVNPAVFKRFAETMAAEQQRRDRAHEKIMQHAETIRRAYAEV